MKGQRSQVLVHTLALPFSLGLLPLRTPPPLPSSPQAGKHPLLRRTAAHAPLALVGPCRGWDGGGSVESASWLRQWCQLPPRQDLVSACALPSVILPLFPEVPPASLTSASPHPALGDHLPFCCLHPRLCAGDFKALFLPPPLSQALFFHSVPSCPSFPHALSSSPFVQGLFLSLFFIIND